MHGGGEKLRSESAVVSKKRRVCHLKYKSLDDRQEKRSVHREDLILQRSFESEVFIQGRIGESEILADERDQFTQLLHHNRPMNVSFACP